MFVHESVWCLNMSTTNIISFQGMTRKHDGQQGQEYKQLLEALNDVAHHEVTAWLQQQDSLSEPAVARCISQQLPEGLSCTVHQMLIPCSQACNAVAWSDLKKCCFRHLKHY